MQAAVEVVRRRRASSRAHVAHARHDPHVEDDVDAVGDLDADLRVIGDPSGPHDVRDDVHRAALHRARRRACPAWRRRRPAPSSCWSGPASSLVGVQMKVQVLDARDVVGVGAVQVAAGELLRVERDEHPGGHGLLGEVLVLVFRAVDPHHVVGLGHGRDLVDPLQEGLVGDLHRTDRRRYVRVHHCLSVSLTTPAPKTVSSVPRGSFRGGDYHRVSALASAPESPRSPRKSGARAHGLTAAPARCRRTRAGGTPGSPRSAARRAAAPRRRRP